MSCRIEHLVVADSSLVFRVSGRLEGEYVAMLQGLLTHVTGEVTLDLKEVTFVDRHAVTLLALCERSGVELKNLPAYLRDWISKEQDQVKGG